MQHSESRPNESKTSPAIRPVFGYGLCIACLSIAQAATAGLAEDVVGGWKLLSHTTSLAGASIDTHSALLRQRPCAADIRYELGADNTYRLNTSASACDERYKKTQEKLYAKMKWRMEGNRITTSSSNFAVGNTYTVTFNGNRMTWVGTDKQGTLVFQRQ